MIVNERYEIDSISLDTERGNGMVAPQHQAAQSQGC